MPKITAIKPQQRNSERVSIFLDDEFALGLQRTVASELEVGQTIGRSDLRRLEQREAEERGYEAALRYLSYRPRSEQEMQWHLAQKDLQQSVIDQVLARLERADFIDDRDFAEFWIENRKRCRPRGAWALRSELRQKGVSDKIIEDALVDLDEKALALKAARQASRKYAHVKDEETFRRRFFAYLKRRGFDYSICWEMTDRFWNELQNQKDPGALH